MGDLTERLKSVPLFRRLEAKQLKRLGDQMAERSWKEGDAVVEEGRGGAGFWVIEDGNATVSIRGEDVRTLGPGDHFGEVALLDDGPRSATVTAGSDLRCRGLAAWEFKSFIESNPGAAWAVMQTLAGRLRDAEAPKDG